MNKMQQIIQPTFRPLGLFLSLGMLTVVIGCGADPFPEAQSARNNEPSRPYSTLRSLEECSSAWQQATSTLAEGTQRNYNRSVTLQPNEEMSGELLRTFVEVSPGSMEIVEERNYGELGSRQSFVTRQVWIGLCQRPLLREGALTYDISEHQQEDRLMEVLGESISVSINRFKVVQQLSSGIYESDVEEWLAPTIDIKPIKQIISEKQVLEDGSQGERVAASPTGWMVEPTESHARGLQPTVLQPLRHPKHLQGTVPNAPRGRYQ